ncbi:hypothetical protein [Neobacillus sp. LXY-4]|uniref:hypothetical protein n=1 Tax=Neobacillus sp. LXY-4 TaxID=3379826 RepID=UPI003EE1CA5D
MVTFCCINDLKEVSEALENLEKDYPNLYKQLVEMVYLTRALNFKMQFMGALIMDEDPGEYTPVSVHDSVLNLYKRELHALKDHGEFSAIKQIFTKFKHTSYTNICLLILGMNPESLVGASYSR